MAELTVIGKPVTRVDANEKVTGQIVYGYDLVLPNMLYGKTLFSPKAHAKIKSIDTEKAKQLPGVVAVVTGEDAPWTHGEAVKDKPFLAQGKVRYIGEPVAAVAAEDEDIAQAAVKLIEVEYEDLPVYTDPEEACKPGCMEIHEDYDKYRKANFMVPGAAPNVAEHFKLRTGDVEVGFKQSDLVLEERYFVPMIQHAAMEPHSAHAQWDKESGRLTIWVANDAPFRALHEITEALNMPKEKIRFINPAQGGGFGSKGGLKVEPIAVALAFHTNGRPVRVKFNREETFISTLTRHEAVVYSKTGVKKDGTLMAREMTIYWGAGAYAEKSPTVCIRGSSAGARSLSNSPCQSRRLRGLHQQAGGRFLSRLRHSPGRLGRRTTDGRARQTARHERHGYPHEKYLRRRRHVLLGRKAPRRRLERDLDQSR